MRAVIYEAYGAPPRLAEVPDPDCPADGVVVEVLASGVCRSDWHAWSGHDPVPLPMVPGHELAGRIVEVGPEVRCWRIGARVTVPFACGCGRCAHCASGDTHVCPDQTQPGFTRWGSFAQFVALEAADANLVALPESLPSVAAAALGCRVATAYGALRHAEATGPGTALVVFGCGGVGLSAVALAASRGVRVLAVDPAGPARAAALGVGAAHALDPTGLDPAGVAAAIRDVLGGGAHASIDALGHQDLLAAGLLALRPRGRHAQVGLLLGGAGAPAVPMGPVIARELVIRGVHGLPARRYPAMLAELAAGAIDLGRLVGRVIPLPEAPAALVGMGTAAPHAGMTVLDLSR